MRSTLASTIHAKCRGGLYPRSKIERFFIPDDKVNWQLPYEQYNPPYYDADSIKGKPWADPDISKCTYVLFDRITVMLSLLLEYCG